MMRSYSELSLLSSFELRFDYLKLSGTVGRDTFGFDRWINQQFYQSREWRDVRHEVIARDYGCDLGVEGYEISGGAHIHHMNPMSPQDITDGNADILDPRFLITVSQRTHNAIHYGTIETSRKVPDPRQPGDTQLW
jgi:hypothetical protein